MPWRLRTEDGGVADGQRRGKVGEGEGGTEEEEEEEEEDQEVKRRRRRGNSGRRGM